MFYEMFENLLVNIPTVMISLSALLISFMTLKKNSQMIENSTRPYIAVYSHITNYSGAATCKIVIKNFGNSSARITKFSHFGVQQLVSHNKKPFDKIKGLNLAPQQLISIDLDCENQDANNLKFKFEVEYESYNKMKYSEEFIESIDSKVDILHLRPNMKDSTSAEKVIAHALIELNEKLF